MFQLRQLWKQEEILRKEEYCIVECLLIKTEEEKWNTLQTGPNQSWRIYASINIFIRHKYAPPKILSQRRIWNTVVDVRLDSKYTSVSNNQYLPIIDTDTRAF